MSNIVQNPEQVKKCLIADLDAAMAAARAFEAAHGDECIITEPPIDGEAELYRALRGLKQRYAQVLDLEVTDYEEGLWTWASPDYCGDGSFEWMTADRRATLVRCAEQERTTAAAIVRDFPDKFSRQYIEARSRLDRAEGTFRALYYWHVHYLVVPPIRGGINGGVLKVERARVRARADEYSATDLHLLENVMFK